MRGNSGECYGITRNQPHRAVTLPYEQPNGTERLSPVKGYPLSVFYKDQARRDHQFRKVIRLNSHLLMALQVDSGLL